MAALNANTGPILDAPCSEQAPGGARQPWPRRVGLLNDYVRIPYANGSTFASRFLYRELGARGHEVTVVGPDDPDARDGDLPRRHVCLPAVPLRTHPGVRLPLPTPTSLARVAAQRFDLVLAQCSSELLDLGVWLRATRHIPLLCVNTLHLPSAYNVLLPDGMLDSAVINALFAERVVPWAERQHAAAYNQGDGLIVLSRGLSSYWRRRGVTVPIHVIPRAIDPSIFDRDPGPDPFDPAAPRGKRLLTVCRHTREKGISRVLRLFAEHVAPAEPDATLTLIGDGPDHEAFRAEARALGIAGRVFFPGEFPLTEIPRFYAHADVFLYPSLSETYGQVISEAMWCGLPVVAFADGMGVSSQLEHGRTGLLVAPGPNEADADQQLAHAALRLLREPAARRAYALRARTDARDRVHPARILAQYARAFESARAHCERTTEARIARPLSSVAALGRWAAVQGLTFSAGCIRPPAVVDRHRRGQPTWDDQPPTPSSALAKCSPQPSASPPPGASITLTQ